MLYCGRDAHQRFGEEKGRERERERERDARTGKVLTSAAPGKKQFANISLARSAIDANKSFLGATLYPYTTAMIVDAVNLSDAVSGRGKEAERDTTRDTHVRRWASISSGACAMFFTS